MKYRKFSNLDVSVSEIGFGTWAIGGNSYGHVDDKESIRALKYAFDNGINFYDTADIYGNGHSEKLIGEIFKDSRDNIILTTKAGYTNYNNKVQDFSEKHIRKSIEKSLKRLNTDYVDIYFLHSPPRDICSSDYAYETLERLKEEGKIRFSGVSVRTANDGLLALQKHNFDSIQVAYNLIDQRPLQNGLLDIARDKNICLVVKAPLCFGFLTGKYSIDSEFDKDDHRKGYSIEQRNKWVNTANQYQFLCNKYTRSRAQASLKFCLSHPGVTVVIPGMKTIQQVEENIGSVQVSSLTKSEFSKIKNMGAQIEL